MTENPTPRLSPQDHELLAQPYADERDTYPSQAIGGLVLSLYAAMSSPAASPRSAADFAALQAR